MHWLPLVAMVIASALPFPHNPVSSAAVTTTQSGSDRERRPDPASEYNLRGNASQTNYSAAAAGQHSDRQNLQNRKDYAKTSAFRLENHVTYRSQDKTGVPAEGAALGTEDAALPKDYKANGQDYPKSAPHDNAGTPLKVSTVQHSDVVSPEPSEPTTRSQHTITGSSEKSPTMEPGQRVRMESFLEVDELFLDAHPRVLFSPSPSPPEHPPLLFMLESGLLEEDGDGEQRDTHIEGHGDHAIEKGTTPGWPDYSKFTSKEAVHPVKRDKRSDLMDEKRGERSVCESESFWVNKETAIDIHSKTVTILQDIKLQNGNISIKQYFYETRCRRAEQESHGNRARGAAAKPADTGLAGMGCLGVDKSQWLSNCTAKQSYVRALTTDANNRTGWRWIRIDSSCVCVLLSRANLKGKPVIMKGRG